MRLRRLALSTGVLLALNAPAHAARSESYAYVAGPGDLTVVNCDGSVKVTETGLGGTCFDVLRGDATVAITAADATGLPISVTYGFRDAADSVMGDYVQFCGTSPTVAVPEGAKGVIAYVDTALVATSPCTGTPGTTGTLTAVYG